MRVLVFAYGAACYLLFLATFLYAAGFIGGFAVPKALNDGVVGSAGLALGINAALLAAFAIQHTIMARPAFKALWTKIIPPAAERSTFVLATVACFGLMFYFWRPVPGVLWHVDHSALRAVVYGCYATGVLTVLVATFLIGHFELFGLAQAWNHLRGQTPVKGQFRMPWLYKRVRHPIMLGFLIMMWSTPTMTVGHLFFAVMTTCYIFIGVQFEERDLRRAHPAYDEYRKSVPMILPLPRHSAPASATSFET